MPRVNEVLTSHLSPERTRRATLTERLSVRHFEWDTVVRFNAWLELLGKTATFVYSCVIASIVIGLDPRT